MSALRKPDGDLPSAVRSLHDAIDRLIEPQTRWFELDGRKRRRHHAPCLYLQLFDAVPGEQGSGHNPARSMPNLWLDAFQLLDEIDTAIGIWQPQGKGVPVTVGRLRVLREKSWRPQDTRGIGQITDAVLEWATRIEQLLDPDPVKTISAPCPICKATTAYKNDSAGERVRTPALHVSELGCTCQVCKTYWHPGLFDFLRELLGFEKPAGML